MRNVIAVGIVCASALMAAPAFAADYPNVPQYPKIDFPQLPQVDYGLVGGFYLRGSAAVNAWYATDGSYCGCVATFNAPGYGYSLGVGFGYETGTGVRTDITGDYLRNDGLTATTGQKVNLRSGLVLANIYYDFPISGGGAAGGFGAYVGAGIGASQNYSEIPATGAWGTSLEAAGAVMAGVTYDMGTVVADLGYRGIYMNKVMSQPATGTVPYLINNNFIHELRATLRYRFN